MTWEPVINLHTWCLQRVTGYMIKAKNDKKDEKWNTRVMEGSSCQYYIPQDMLEPANFSLTVKLCALNGAQEGNKCIYQVKGQIRHQKVIDLSYTNVGNTVSKSLPVVQSASSICKGDIVDVNHGTNI